jgi:hypothetical protein
MTQQIDQSLVASVYKHFNVENKRRTAALTALLNSKEEVIA